MWSAAEQQEKQLLHETANATKATQAPEAGCRGCIVAQCTHLDNLKHTGQPAQAHRVWEGDRSVYGVTCAPTSQTANQRARCG